RCHHPSTPPFPYTTLFRSRHIYVPVTIGEDEVWALWDTGVSMSVVHPSFVEKYPQLFEARHDAAMVDSTNRTARMTAYNVKKISDRKSTRLNSSYVATSYA